MNATRSQGGDALAQDGNRLVDVSADGNVAVVTLCRPARLNAISTILAEQLTGVLKKLANDPDVWVLVLTAQGDNAFCAGADIHERRSMSASELAHRRCVIKEMFTALRCFPQPTVAAVFGYVLGGGFELALSCDVILAADDAVFGFPEGRIGLIPAGGGTVLACQVAGAQRAKSMIFTGRRIGTDEAAAAGFILRVVARNDLLSASFDLAREMCACSPIALREAKWALNRGFAGWTESGLGAEDEASSRVARSADATEGILAFAEKRQPRWQNR